MAEPTSTASVLQNGPQLFADAAPQAFGEQQIETDQPAGDPPAQRSRPLTFSFRKAAIVGQP
ncbi:hypothetical protein, partial [Methylocaldum sp.]|uniref:hypothetical protein n=1 Tax=Methylocaldum sp. TaxID=1969727 RepID=UPI00321F6498